jgi:thiol:disulfide interchange protein
MSRGKVATLIISVLTGMLFIGAVAAKAPPLARVVLVTTSKACDCTLERCRAGEELVQQVFAKARPGLLQRLDYAVNKNQAKEYIKKYHLFTLPALLFLDDQGNLLWSAVGELAGQPLAEKLAQFGG